MDTPRILNVGQCAFDKRSMAGHLSRKLAAEVTPAETFDEALAELRARRFDLVLVNRVTDADGSLGLELIETLKAEPTLAAIPVMLVSDQAQAQARAVALGACPGFGKSELSRDETFARIREALAGRD